MRSPFYQPAAAMGATFMEEAGWYWTEGFGDTAAEYAGVARTRRRGRVPAQQVGFRGPAASAAAQRVHTNNIQGLRVGQVRYGGGATQTGCSSTTGRSTGVRRPRVGHDQRVGPGRSFADATAGLGVDIRR